MLATFADSFVPRAQAFEGNSPVASALALSGSFGGQLGTQSQLLATPLSQVKQYKLWNYVAVNRNSWSASKSFPNVSVLRRGSAGKSQAQHLSKQQQGFLRRHYSGLLKTSSDDLEPVAAEHPLMKLLENPNPTDWWGSFAFETYLFFGLTGGFYWWVVPNGLGLPAELYVIPTHWVTPVYSRSGELLKYKITGMARQIDLSPEEVIPAILKNPHGKGVPYSPVQAGAEWVINNGYIETSKRRTLEQGPFPSVVLSLDGKVYDQAPNQELLDAIGEKFMQRYSGSAQAGRPIVAPPGITVTPWSHKPTEMDYGESGMQNCESILALHGTPKAVAGLSHDLNRASIDGAHLIHAENTVIPMQTWVAGVATHKLAKRFDEKLRVWFDDCRPRDNDHELRETELDWRMGAVSPDERRQERGRPALGTPAATKTYVQMGLTPLEDFDESPDERKPDDPIPAAGDDAHGDDGSETGADDATGDGGDEAGDSPASDAESKQHVARCVHGFIAGSTGSAVTQARHRRLSRVGKQYLALHGAVELRAFAAAKRFMQWAKKYALARWDSGSTDTSHPTVDELVPVSEFRPAFNRAMSPTWETACVAGVRFEAEALGRDVSRQSVKQAEELPNINVEMSPALKEAVREFLAERTEGVWSQVLATTRTALADAINQGVQAGLGMREIRKQVESVLSGRKEDALMIARTEATASINYGQQSLRDVEQITQKAWISTVDKKTRSSHAGADMQIVQNNQPFVVGGARMMHPGDGSLGASADEIVNCRCCATGYVE